MNPSAFGAFIEAESGPLTGRQEAHAIPTAPQRPLIRTYHSFPAPDDLDNIERGTKAKGAPSGIAAPSGYQTPRTPNDVEMSRSPSPHNEQEDFVVMQSFSNPPMNRYRVISGCLLNFGNGLNDGAPGVLLPSIEKHYNIGYAVVSLIFVSNAVGFILAAFFVDALRARFGRAKTLMIGQCIMACGYIPIVTTAPFPAIIASFFVLGFGIAINLAMNNTFHANLHNSTKMLGAIHGSYGIGGTCGPIIATGMVEYGGLFWSRYYCIALGICLFNLCFAGWSYWNYEAEAAPTLLAAIELTARNSLQAPQNSITTQLHNIRQVFSSKVVILGALFIFAYQGAEVSISGWVMSFLISTRHGNPSHVGYVTAGFWAGITLGRFFLSHPAHKVGEKLFVYVVLAGSIVFELLVWLVPNIIGEAVALAIVGLLLGPVYPCATVIFSRAIKRSEQLSSLSVISAFGSSGGAIAPFTTGILAQAVGTFVLHPIAIGLFLVMVGCWFFLPEKTKRTD